MPIFGIGILLLQIPSPGPFLTIAPSENKLSQAEQGVADAAEGGHLLHQSPESDSEANLLNLET